MPGKQKVCCEGYCEDWEPIGPAGGTLADGTTFTVAGNITDGDPATGDIEWLTDPMVVQFSAPVQIRITPYGIPSPRVIWHEQGATSTQMEVTGGGCSGWTYTPGTVDTSALFEVDGDLAATLPGANGIDVNADWGQLYASHLTEFTARTVVYDAARFEVAPLVLGCKKCVCEVIDELRCDTAALRADVERGADLDEQTLTPTEVDGVTTEITISNGNTIPILHPAVPEFSTITVDRSSLFRAPVTETDMHDDADVLMDLGPATTIEAGWTQGPAVNEVTRSDAADRIEGVVNIVAPDAGASNYWSRPYVIVTKNGDRFAWIDAGSVMQTNGTYSGRAVFTGSFTDDDPAPGDVYGYVLFNEDNRTATLPADTESHVSLTAIERVQVLVP